MSAKMADATVFRQPLRGSVPAPGAWADINRPQLGPGGISIQRLPVAFHREWQRRRHERDRLPQGRGLLG